MIVAIWAEEGRDRVSRLVSHDLSGKQRAVFAIAQHAPGFYCCVNDLKNPIKSEQYRSRKVVTAS